MTSAAIVKCRFKSTCRRPLGGGCGTDNPCGLGWRELRNAEGHVFAGGDGVGSGAHSGKV